MKPIKAGVIKKANSQSQASRPTLSPQEINSLKTNGTEFLATALALQKKINQEKVPEKPRYFKDKNGVIIKNAGKKKSNLSQLDIL